MLCYLNRKDCYLHRLCNYMLNSFLHFFFLNKDVQADSHMQTVTVPSIRMQGYGEKSQQINWIKSGRQITKQLLNGWQSKLVCDYQVVGIQIFIIWLQTINHSLCQFGYFLNVVFNTTLATKDIKNNSAQLHQSSILLQSIFFFHVWYMKEPPNKLTGYLPGYCFPVKTSNTKFRLYWQVLGNERAAHSYIEKQNYS